MKKWWDGLSKNEKFLFILLIFMTGAFIGLISYFLVSRDFSWDAVSAIIAILAVILAYFGYRSSQRANILEHKAYLKVTVKEASFNEDTTFRITFNIENQGRTPAQNVRVKWYCLPRYLSDLNGPKRGPYYSHFDMERAHSGVSLITVDTFGAFGVKPCESVRYAKETILVGVFVSYQDVFDGVEKSNFKFSFCGAHAKTEVTSGLIQTFDILHWPDIEEPN